MNLTELAPGITIHTALGRSLVWIVTTCGSDPTIEHCTLALVNADPSTEGYFMTYTARTDRYSSTTYAGCWFSDFESALLAAIVCVESRSDR